MFCQFQTELRKILVSLIEVAQKLLALNPDAVELFKKANGKDEELLKLGQSLDEMLGNFDTFLIKQQLHF